jgi:hypothetical protein
MRPNFGLRHAGGRARGVSDGATPLRGTNALRGHTNAVVLNAATIGEDRKLGMERSGRHGVPAKDMAGSERSCPCGDAPRSPWYPRRYRLRPGASLPPSPNCMPFGIAAAFVCPRRVMRGRNGVAPPETPSLNGLPQWFIGLLFWFPPRRIRADIGADSLEVGLFAHDRVVKSCLPCEARLVQVPANPIG